MAGPTILKAEFLGSFPSYKILPDSGGLPEVALLGRSNVGKSSFLNAMVMRKQLAKTSNTPGKTRAMNVYELEVRPGKSQGKSYRFRILDLPGYGFAKVSKEEQGRWGVELTHLFEKRETLKQVVQLIDARHGMLENDWNSWEWSQGFEHTPVLVFTKTDKLKRQDLQQQQAKVKRFEALEGHPQFWMSAETRQGVDAVWSFLLGRLAH
jgi:GTP-binding protein